MAGVDQDFQGEAWAAKGTKIGYLPQEPQLDPDEGRARERRAGGEGAARAARRFNEICDEVRRADERRRDDKLLDEQASVQEHIDTLDLWNLDNKIEIAMDALRLPPDDADVTKLSGGEKRRVALCRVLLEQPDMLLLDEPTNHLDAESVEWLERYPRGVSRAPSSRSRTIATSSTTSRSGSSSSTAAREFRARGTTRAGSSRSRTRLAQEEKTESRASAHAAARARVGAHGAARAAGEEQGAHPEVRGARRARTRASKVLAERDHHSAAAAARQRRRHREGLKKAYGDKVLFDDLTFSLPRGGIVGVIGPNGAGKTTLFRMIIGEEKPDGGELKVGETVKLAYVDQGRVLDASKTAYQEVSGGRDEITVGKREINARAYLSSSTSAARISRRRSATCRVESATDCTWRSC